MSCTSGARHRGLAPSWCRHDVVDRVAKAASDGVALVEASETGMRVPHADDNHQRVDTFHNLLEASPSTFSPALMYASIAQASVNPESRLD